MSGAMHDSIDTNHTRTPKVSVITGYYNRADCVDSTILSILNQSYTDIELIAFDDRSADGTGNRLLELQDRLRDDRFKVIIHEKNKGFTVGMIDAIAGSRGEYVCVQGSGDVSLPERVRRQVAVLDSMPDVGVVGCWYTNVVDGSGHRRQRKPIADNVGFAELMKANIFSHGEVMMRRSVYDLAGGYRPQFRFCQDIDLWLRASKHSRLHTVKDFLYDRHVRFDGVSYHPDKFPLQARYAILTRKAASLSGTELEDFLKILGASGPEVLVPADDKTLQRLLRSAVLRSAVFGGSVEAEKLASKITNRVLRAAFIFFSRCFGFAHTLLGRRAGRIR